MVVGYTDGKVETIAIEAKETPQHVAAVDNKSLRFPKNKRRAEEAMTVAELVEKVDAWARTLKAKEEGGA